MDGAERSAKWRARRSTEEKEEINRKKTERQRKARRQDIERIFVQEFRASGAAVLPADPYTAELAGDIYLSVKRVFEMEDGRIRHNKLIRLKNEVGVYKTGDGGRYMSIPELGDAVLSNQLTKLQNHLNDNIVPKLVPGGRLVYPRILVAVPDAKDPVKRRKKGSFSSHSGVDYTKNNYDDLVVQNIHRDDKNYDWTAPVLQEDPPFAVVALTPTTKGHMYRSGPSAALPFIPNSARRPHGTDGKKVTAEEMRSIRSEEKVLYLLNPGDAVFIRSSHLHRGAAYSHLNYRIHFYAEMEGRDRTQYAAPVYTEQGFCLEP